jgi:membrane-bound lytic murein transglycosylase D
MNRLIISFISLLLLAGCASTTSKTGNTSGSATKATITTADVDAGEFASILFKNSAPTRSANAPRDDLWARLRSGFELPDLDNDRVSYYENKFTRNPGHFYTMVNRAQWFMPYILTEVENRGYPSELALLPAVESAFIADAKSRSSASGLWQFIPGTGKLYNLKQDWWYDGRRDPMLSTQAALKFLGELEQRFDGDWFHALAAYNSGGWTVEQAIKTNKGKRRSTHFNDLALRKETQDYVPKLIAYRNIFRDPARFGLELPELGNAQQFARLEAGSQIDLALFAQKAGVDARTMRFLNSAYRRNITPPDGPHVLYVPSTTLSKSKLTLAGLSKNDRLHWAHYRVKKGDLLGRIAKSHSVSVSAIKQSNQLISNLIHPGDILLIPVVSSETVVARAPQSSSGRVTHHVRQGDTLWGIAQRYGVNVAQISKWNQINQSNTLSLGQKLTIYTRS